MAYAEAPVPDSVGAGLKVNVVVPSLVIVTDNVFGAVCVPKANEPVIFTSVPVPVTGSCNDVTPFGSPVKFAVTVPGITPSVLPGLNATLNKQVWFWVSAVLPVRLQAPLLIPVVFKV